MPINALQQNAFNLTQSFQGQVIAEVKKQALDLSEGLDRTDPNYNSISQVIKYPDQFFFGQTIVADYNWTIGFDDWAMNPSSAEGAIQTFVAKYFNLLTGYAPPQPQPETATTSMESEPEPEEPAP